MIPYLLGIDSYEKNLMGTVENNPIFFPPVIAIVVPITSERRPEKYYPGEVHEETRSDGETWHSVSQKSEPMKNLLLSSPVNKPPPTNTHNMKGK